MAHSGRLIGLVAIGQQLSDQMRLRRFLALITLLLMLVVVSGVMIGALVLTGLYILYQQLVMEGFYPIPALIITGGAAATITLSLLAGTYIYMRRAMQIPRLAGYLETKLKPVFGAFIDGLLTPSAKHESRAAPSAGKAA